MASNIIKGFRFLGFLPFYIVSSTMLFTACDPAVSSSVLDADEPFSLNVAPDLTFPITFSPAIGIEQTGSLTRALDPLKDTPELFKTFGASVLWHRPSISPSTTNCYYLNNVTVKRPEDGVLWRTEPSAYWPTVGTLDFFMYAPTKSEDTSIEAVCPVTGLPVMRYTPEPVDLANQLDFCMAEPVYGCTVDDYGPSGVPATFRHTLTNVEFYVNYTGNIPSTYNVYLDEITVEDVIGSKTVTWTDSEPYFQWQADSECTTDASYTLFRLQSHLKNEVLPSVNSSPAGSPVQNSAGRLYLLPQTLQEGEDCARLHVVYGFYYGTMPNATLITPFDKYIDLPTTEWPADKTVRYHVTINVGESSEITLSCEILPFTDAQVLTDGGNGSFNNPSIYY